jgi:hypothetical protein
MSTLPYGFRVVGGKTAERRLVDHRAALAAYAACDPRAEVEREAFLSHFAFPVEFRRHLEAERSERGYTGPCGADWLYWDVDRPGDLAAALRDARGLAGAILERYRELDDDDLLIFLSGGKGLHVGVPTALWRPDPSPQFHDVARRFALAHAERAGVVADPTIYSKTRLFRAPNSRHPSGRYKRRLMLDELTYLSADAILALAVEPAPFDLPTPAVPSATAAADWLEAARAVERRAFERREAAAEGTPRLNATTLDFIRDGAPDGERATRLFRAAANLGEFDCPPALAHALLSEAALDSGLTPSETRRQIDTGLAHARRQQEGGAA